MKPVFRVLIAGAVLAVPVGMSGAMPAVAKPPPPSNSYTCTGTFGTPGTIAGGTYSSLVMPAGSVCEIAGGSVVVNSAVTLGAGSALAVAGGSLTINGG